MNCIIPFTKDIKFKTNISEILSISLEHEYTVNDSELLGNFTVTGDYKSHEVSVNKEHFEHVLPFSVTLAGKINTDSLDFNIEDFTYEVLDNSILKVDIEYSIKAEEVKEEPIIFERDESEDDFFEELLETVDEEIEKEEEREEKQPKEIEEIVEENNKIEKVEENIIKKEVEEKEEMREDDIITEEKVVEERDVSEESKETILNSISNDEDAFVTYHIHVLKENETIETVCTMYNTSSSIIGEYNDLSNIAIGDKIIIPDIDE